MADSPCTDSTCAPHTFSPRGLFCRGMTVLVAAAILLTVASALAEALVVVEVRGVAAEGEVTLSAVAGEQSYSCQVAAGSCRISHVPGGRYVVRFRGADGEARPARPVMIPPSGTVTLVVPAPGG